MVFPAISSPRYIPHSGFAILEPGIDPDTVVTYREDPILALLDCGNVCVRLLPATELQAIANQVLKELNHLSAIGWNNRQRVAGNRCIGLIYSYLQVLEYLIENPLTVGRFESPGVCSDSRVCQEAIYQI